MSVHHPTAPAPLTDREALLQRVAALGARPFQHQVVQSPWNAVVDVPSLHCEAKQAIRDLIDSCGRPEVARCRTFLAPPGYGKTHLLAWTRQMLDERNDAVFVHVPPYLPDGGPLEAHLLLATIDALRLRSHRQSQL